MSLSDQSVLAANTAFVGRVQEALAAACVSIANEATTAPLHYSRARLAAQILVAGTSPPGWPQLFAYSVATDANVISDATQAGTVALTAANIAAQQALVTDAHIATAVSSQFNSFFFNQPAAPL